MLRALLSAAASQTAGICRTLYGGNGVVRLFLISDNFKN